MIVDQDAVVAIAELVGRSGGRGFEIGYVNDDPPHLWYAQAKYRGERIIAEGKDDPAEAADALARKILDGGQCAHCRRTVRLSDGRGDVCRWTRMGATWKRGCE